MSKFVAKENQTKLFCNICKNNNKSMVEYTSHNTKKVINGAVVVVCPTILNSNCTYCKEKGHFKSECPILKNKNNQAKYTDDFKKNESTKSNMKKTNKSEIKQKELVKSDNLFASAFLDSDDDEDETIRTSSTKNIEKVSFKYLSAVSDNIIDDIVVQNKDSFIPTAQLSILSKIVKEKDLKHSWADDEYWESDDEDINIEGGGIYRHKPYVSNYPHCDSSETSESGSYSIESD